MQNGQNLLLCQCPDIAFYPTAPKFVSEDANKMSKSQQLTETTKALYTSFTFFDFNFLDLLIKLMEMMPLYILYCSPSNPLPPPHELKDFMFPWTSDTS
jgi:hypothetical protein